MSDECKHGSLRRSCEICERDEQITQLKRKLAETKWKLRLTRDQIVDVVVAKQNARAELAKAKAEIKRLTGLRAICVEEELAEYLKQDKAVLMSTDQIDAAWENSEMPREVDDKRVWASDLGINTCEECGGSGGGTVEVEEDGRPWGVDVICSTCHGHGWKIGGDDAETAATSSGTTFNERAKECALTLRDWQLFSTEPGVEVVVAALNTALAWAFENIKTPRGVRKYMHEVMDHYTRYGARDTEPEQTLVDAINAYYGLDGSDYITRWN